ncbi:hypothetical protein [Streptomyces sp. NPDC004266]|uniref:hypothetical protein n=1 Tax=Streptomyces sp. NPDC004266 TaxID=3364693 RepID=UPI0036856BCC
MARTTSTAMRELMELSGASQSQIERWQQQGFLPRFPRAYAGGGGSRSVLNEEITERAHLLAGHARQGTLALGSISLIATLAEPDIELLREAVLKNLTALRKRAGMNITASSPEEAGLSRLAAAQRRARREGRAWNLKDFETGPVRTGSMDPLVEVFALLNRDSDEEINPDDLETAVDVLVKGMTVSGPGFGEGFPIGLLVSMTKPEGLQELRDEIRRILLGRRTFPGQCELVRTVPADQLIRACRLVPLARRVQIAAVASARIAQMRHNGERTEKSSSGWQDLGMSYADMQRMTEHPMWKSWGEMLAGGGVHDSGDGLKIVHCLENPATLDQLEGYIEFLVSLIPAHALHRLASYQAKPGDITVK